MLLKLFMGKYLISHIAGYDTMSEIKTYKRKIVLLGDGAVGKTSLIRRFGFNELLLVANNDPDLAKKIVGTFEKNTQRKLVIGVDELINLLGNMYLKENPERINSEVVRFGEDLRRYSQEDYMVYYVEGILTIDGMAQRGICKWESVEGLSQTVKRSSIFGAN